MCVCEVFECVCECVVCVMCVCGGTRAWRGIPATHSRSDEIQFCKGMPQIDLRSIV